MDAVVTGAVQDFYIARGDLRAIREKMQDLDDKFVNLLVNDVENGTNIYGEDARTNKARIKRQGRDLISKIQFELNMIEEDYLK